MIGSLSEELFHTGTFQVCSVVVVLISFCQCFKTRATVWRHVCYVCL